mmetsp:Transcript_10507/g.22805  ORF Transcript_10507/g.22805 Transcript_10507/m.22805 type:complete len:300 (-) Transcript_10507:169-1068(-)
MSANLPYKQAANVERRTWDKEVYEARARARNEAAEVAGADAAGQSSSHQSGMKRPASGTTIAAAPGNPSDATTNTSATAATEEGAEEFVPAARGAAGPERSQRAYLKARKSKVDLESKLGSSEIINPDAVAVSGGAAPADPGAVSISDGVTKSSTGVGWHCKVCDCFLKDSMTYLDHINGRKHQRYLGYSMRVEKSTKHQVTSRLSALAEVKRKAELAATTAALRGENPAADQVDEFEDAVRRKDEEALQRKTERARRREERKKEQEEQDEEEEELSGGLDPAMAAMMGFNGFGGSKKN